MILNELGKIVRRCYFKIPKHNTNIVLDEFVIMPNHIHGIIEINNVGNAYMRSEINGNVKINNRNARDNIDRNAHVRSLHPDRTKMLLSKIVHGFKSAVAKEINKMRNYNVNFKWQKSFYDHIIRDGTSLNKIREYIQINPTIWERDRNNLENLRM